MRYLLLALSLLIFLSSPVYSQQQYTEGACIMLQQQIDRFSNQKQNSNFRNATREYEKFCRKPVMYAPQHIQTNESNQLLATQLEQKEQVVVTTATEPNLPENIQVTKSTQAIKNHQTNISEPIALKPVVVVNAPPLSTRLVDDSSEDTSLDTGVGVSVDATPHFSADLIMQIVNNIPLIIANIFAMLLAVFLLTTWFGLNLPGFKGVFAEYKLNRLLRWRFSRQYQHFRKLKLLTANDELVIVDHLVLCPYGIFVITVKSERGRISGNETQANWSRYYLGTTKKLMNPLHQNFKSVAAVKHLLRLEEADGIKLVHSVAAFSRLAKFKNAISANITYIDTVSIYLNQFTEPCLTDEQQSRFAAQLKQASIEH